jgi:putative endonuclease
LKGGPVKKDLRTVLFMEILYFNHVKPTYRRMLQGLKGKGSSSDTPGEAPVSPWFLYILQCSDGSLYTGITNDLTRRTQRHNEGKGARYTRTRRPVTLLYYETCGDRSAALIREAAVKALPPRKKRDLAGA